MSGDNVTSWKPVGQSTTPQGQPDWWETPGPNVTSWKPITTTDTITEVELFQGPDLEALRASFDSFPENKTCLYVEFIIYLGGDVYITFLALVNGLAYADVSGLYYQITAEIHEEFLKLYPQLKPLKEFVVPDFDPDKHLSANSGHKVKAYKPYST